MTSGTTRTGRPARNRMAPGSTKSAYVAARAGWPDKDHVGGPCLPRHQLGWQFKSGAPFHLFEMLPLNAQNFLPISSKRAAAMR